MSNLGTKEATGEVAAPPKAPGAGERGQGDVMVKGIRTALLGSVAAVAVVAASAPTLAGGFAIREQSVYSQGASFAGAASNGQLSAMFWNSAAAANLESKGNIGLNFDSNYSLIIPTADITVNSIGGVPVTPGLDRDADIGKLAVVPASYINYQFKNFDPRLFFGLAINAGFGLATKPDDQNYAGSVLGRSSGLQTYIINPVLAYQLSTQLTIGVGLQVMYADGSFKFATGAPNTVAGSAGPNSFFEGDGISVGGTAGLTWKPVAGTTIGLGYRSQMTVELDGRFATTGIAALEPGLSSTVEIDLPDLVTLSLTQALTPNLRLLATGEWTGWSRFKELRVIADQPGATALGARSRGQTIGVIDANWDDGYFVSVGAEYDVSQQLRLRTGVAYEWSPIKQATQRIIGIPDADRVWLSGGLSYEWSKSLSIDFAYTHIFFDDGPFDRRTLPATGQALGTRLTGDVDSSVDIVSIGLRSRW